MPYIITTHRHLDDPTAEFVPDADPAVENRAAATLEEARHDVDVIAARLIALGRPGRSEVFEAIRTLPESGGTIRVLSSVEIVVRRAEWAALAENLHADTNDMTCGEVLAAFNAGA